MSKAIPLEIKTIKCDHRINRVRFGQFRRKHDGKLITRYRCKHCRKTFSDSTFKQTYLEKKPHLNRIIFEHLSSLVSQRRVARILKINRKTVVRKFHKMGLRSETFLAELNRSRLKIKSFQFDELETFEHTRLKPLSVVMSVESDSRWIIGFRIASMRVKSRSGRKISLKRYGPREDSRRPMRRELFKEMKEIVEEQASILSDMNRSYSIDVRDCFPLATYSQFASRRSHNYGQGELKKGFKDPIFSINHTLAMCRANINRLIRKTWCTTKKENGLKFHLLIYSVYHNLYLMPGIERLRRLNQFIDD